MKTLLRNRRQALKVRVMLWASVVACGLALWAGWSIYDSYGLSPGDGGVLRPAWERVLFGAGVGLLGLAVFIGMDVFASLYVVRLAADRRAVEIDVVHLLGTRRLLFDRSDFEAAKHRAGEVHAGIAASGAPRVKAPWLSLPVGGKRLPFVIDLQAEEINTGEIQSLAKGAGRRAGD